MQAKEILMKNNRRDVSSLRDDGFISQASEGKYTITDKTRDLAQYWII